MKRAKLIHDYYDAKMQGQMKSFYKRLSEKDRRSYSALEAKKLGEGGISMISELLECSRDAIHRGLAELEDPEILPEEERIRHHGGGRKQAVEKDETINEKIDEILEGNIAGDPMNEGVKWTHLKASTICAQLIKAGKKLCENTIRMIMGQKGFVKRKAQKRKAIGVSTNRNEQFENIARLKKEYQSQGNPVLSVDTKKKEFLGSLYREGKLYVQKGEELIRWDHDFPYLAEGVAIPNGLYDIYKNEAYINIGTNCETSEFICDSIHSWWRYRGRYDYAGCDSILLLMDAGGGNNCRHYLFKEDLQKLGNRLGKEIRIAHYPPYTSKWNPIEHRVFPHVTRMLEGVVFKSHEVIRKMISLTKTKTGLKVRASILDKVYQKGRAVSQIFKKVMPIIFDEHLGQWNYRAVPQMP